LEPGGEAYAQIVPEEPVTVVAGDRFVARSYSPVTTIGGGIILDPLPGKHKRFSEKILEAFHCLAGKESPERVAVILARAGIAGIPEARLIVRTGIRRAELRKILEEMFSRQQAILVDREGLWVLAQGVYRELQRQIAGELTAYHARFPLKDGLSREALRTTLAMGEGAGQKIFAMALRDLEKRGDILVEGDTLRRTGHKVRLQGEMGDLREKLTALYREAALAPPTTREVGERFPDRKKEIASLIQVLIREGDLVRISEDLNFHREVLERLREDYRGLLLKETRATPASFKELTGLSRKFVIPLMEYFDMTKLTMRAGEHRILRERAER
jgi:selenocysteine-specific elongation factor